MTSIESLHKEVAEIRRDVQYIKKILKEQYELSDWAKIKLREARETPEKDYKDLE